MLRIPPTQNTLLEPDISKVHTFFQPSNLRSKLTSNFQPCPIDNFCLECLPSCWRWFWEQWLREFRFQDWWVCKGDGIQISSGRLLDVPHSFQNISASGVTFSWELTRAIVGSDAKEQLLYVPRFKTMELNKKHGKFFIKLTLHGKCRLDKQINL